MPRWYALCTTYCREKTAYDHLVSKNIEDFYTTMKSIYDDMTASAGEAGKINSGRKIRITEGKFMTVLGTVACDQSQSRVGIMVDGPPTVGTALVPRAFI